jgi:hypothetical protein
MLPGPVSMPLGPRLKLCPACDQVSLVRGDGRGRLRCERLDPATGKRCRCRDAKGLTVDTLNDLRALQKAAWQDERERYRATIREQGAALTNHEKRIRDLEDLIRDALSRGKLRA